MKRHMQRNAIIKLPDGILKTAELQQGTPDWSKYSFREAEQEWIKDEDVDYYHQSHLTLLSDSQLIECIVEKEIEIELEVISLSNHIYLIYIFDDPVLEYKEGDNLNMPIEMDYYVAGYRPKGNSIISLKPGILKPGKYTILYINPLSKWLLSRGRTFTELEQLYVMLETDHKKHETLPPILISPKEEALIIELRLSKYKSEMDLDNSIHTVIEFLFYRCHRRLDNAKNNIVPDNQGDLDRLRNYILELISKGKNPIIYMVCITLNLVEWEIKKLHKDKYNEGVKQFCNRSRLLKAQILLRQGHRVNVVSDKLNYSSPPQLSNQYSAHFGYPPSQEMAVYKAWLEAENKKQSPPG